MKRVSLCLSIALFAMTLQLLAQEHSHWNCGVSAQDGAQIKQAMFETRKEMQDFVRPRNATTYVPVRFYLVAESNGDNRPSEMLALRGLCRMNENYADQNIQFYLKEFKYYNNTTVHTNPGDFGGISAISGQMIYNALNIFVVDEIGEPGVAAYYQLPYGPNGNDWIVAAKAYVDDETTLTHEVGHFFTLNHPFYGWEPSGGWDEQQHGNPVTMTTAPDGETEVEKADGSNCASAGDGLCDTPADYMFPFPGNGCNMSFEVLDANNDALEPDFNNFMNYANCSSYYFTEEQKEAISQSLFSTARNYVRPNYTPNTTVITENATIVSPGASETVATYNSVLLEWTEVDGADFYLVDITSPLEGSRRYIVNNNSTLITDLSANHTYLWRVLPFNEYSTCRGFSSQRIFKTGDIVNDTFNLPEGHEWYIAPNPVQGGSPIFVNVDSSNGLEATVSLRTIAGQLVREVKNYPFPSGISSLEIPTAGMAQGIYLVTLRTENGMETKRVSIVE